LKKFKGEKSPPNYFIFQFLRWFFSVQFERNLAAEWYFGTERKIGHQSFGFCV
jgi:hypothetical protein